MAAARDERVTPLSGSHVPLAVAAMAGGREFHVDQADLLAQATMAAARTVGAVDTSGVVDEPLVLEGHPASLLLDRSGKESVVVVGRRGITALKHRLLGSVSSHLATHARGPVVVVPAGWNARPCRRIVVGFDGSEHASAALRWALDIATDDNEVHLVIALDVVSWLSPQVTAELHGDLIEAAEQRLTDAADRVDPTHRAERSIVLDSPRRALTDVLDDADLVVVGPRGNGALDPAMLGSLTTWLVSTATCPVAVIPATGSMTQT
jgi:nucleotide-binding universal stress UspA family protein